jgi:RNA polymerase sigma factor (sigma-70 family)
VISDKKEIIIECQNGNRQAQQSIYQWLAPQMYALCLRYTHNKMEAEDCLQDGFIKVFTKIDTYGFNGSFEGWVRRIIVNTVIESFRKKTVLSKANDLVDVPEDETPEMDEQTSGLDVKFLHNLIMQLPTQYRIVFSLYVLEDFTHEEISQQLNISVGTSKSNLFRARKWLQNKIEKSNINDHNRYVTAS